MRQTTNTRTTWQTPAEAGPGARQGAAAAPIAAPAETTNGSVPPGSAVQTPAQVTDSAVANKPAAA
jgi:hypothetical protein